jgi:hypothetical protein
MEFMNAVLKNCNGSGEGINFFRAGDHNVEMRKWENVKMYKDRKGLTQ